MTAFFIEDIKEAIKKERNKNWQNSPFVPKWVNLENTDLDQFFTKQDVAKKCIEDMLQFLQSKNIDLSEYIFLEPSAGTGSFFHQLPEPKIGLDLFPLSKGIIEKDFFSFKPQKNKKYIVIGNPPFGYRGWMALSFMQYAATFAEFIGFILPMSFQSDGKGSPKYRIKNMRLAKSSLLEPYSFVDIYNKPKKVNALWQIWERGENIIPKEPKCDAYVDIFTVDLRKERLCGIDKMDKADFFLQRTFFGDKQPTLVKDFSQVKYVCGYGIIIKKDREKVIKALQSIDWNQYCNLATHNCKHISMYHIKRALADKGFCDD